MPDLHTSETHSGGGRNQEARSCFGFGDVRIAMTSGSAEWCRLVEARFGAFRSPGTPRFSIHYDVIDGMDFNGGLAFPDLRRVPGLADTLETSHNGVTARVDLRARNATIRGPMTSAPVDELMPRLLPLLYPEGLILHGGALAEDGRAWLFTGPSGVGKSTLAALFPDKALCDELVAVRAHDGGFWVQSLPYWTAKPGTASLQSICLLRHGVDHVRTRLTPAAALRRLAPQVTWPVLHQGAMAHCFDALAALVETVPVWDLAFAPRADVWRVITQEG